MLLQRFFLLAIPLVWNALCLSTITWAQENGRELRENAQLRAELAEMLRSEDAMKQLEAIERIGKYRSQGSPMLDELIRLLSSENHEVAGRSAMVIGAMGPIAIKAAPVLIANMKNEQAVADAEYLWMGFSRALFGLGPKVIPTLVESIPDANRSQFAGICGALYDFGTAAKPALDAVAIKAQQDNAFRWPAIYVLEAIGKPSVQAMPLLLESLDAADFQVQVITCRALAAIGPEAKAAQPKLLGLAKKGNPSVRGRAAIALGALGIGEKDSSSVLQTLTELLDDPSQVVRERAMIGIGYLKQEGAPLLDRVRKAMTDPKFAARSQACVAYWRISGDSQLAIEQLVLLMDQIDHDLTAISALGELGEAGVDAIPALLKKMESEDLSYALEGCRSLGRMGPAAKSALASIEKLCDSDDAELRIVARAARDEIEHP